MKKTMIWLHLLTSILISVNGLAQTQTPGEKLPVNERMAKARAAKADKKIIKASGQDASGTTAVSNGTSVNLNHGNSLAATKATGADYKAPVVKALKGPNGEVVHTGESGGKYYINKNGNKTYLSSNQ